MPARAAFHNCVYICASRRLLSMITFQASLLRALHSERPFNDFQRSKPQRRTVSFPPFSDEKCYLKLFRGQYHIQ